ncbi:MAG: hypothetical protein IH596_15435 [Bacteroidales bacterium]|nr:hypothetical protein [Bacteroidales bacterium]
MKPTRYIVTIAAVLLLFYSGCSKNEDPSPSTAVYSVNGGTTSHNNGQICLSCHKAGGTGTYNFIIAGSVFKPNLSTPSPNGVLYFWSKPGGTGELVATLQVDANGNFFTTSSLLPAEGAYPQMNGVSGSVKAMPIPAFTGDCNSCHGVNEDPIWIN